MVVNHLSFFVPGGCASSFGVFCRTGGLRLSDDRSLSRPDRSENMSPLCRNQNGLDDPGSVQSCFRALEIQVWTVLPFFIVRSPRLVAVVRSVTSRRPPVPWARVETRVLRFTPVLPFYLLGSVPRRSVDPRAPRPVVPCTPSLT